LADLAYLDLGQDLHRYDHRSIVALDGIRKPGLLNLSVSVVRCSWTG